MEDPLTSISRSLNQPLSPLMAAFFSIANVDVIQNMLKAEIIQRTRYAIDRQSDTDLQVIMRKVYAEHASNSGATEDAIRAEVRRLNRIVLGVVVPMVASGVAGYLNYLRDASRVPEPLPRGQQTSIKGTKMLEVFRGI